MGKSGIEYVDVGWTPQEGCLHYGTDICGTYCWAEKLTKRAPQAHPKGFYPVFHSGRLNEPLKIKGSKTIFTCHTGDMWGNWVREDNIKMIMEIIKQCPQHRFLMLTKNPSRMRRFFTNQNIPENVWLGTSVTKNDELHRIAELPLKSKGGKRWVSFEPLLESIDMQRYALGLKLKQAGIDWVVIGQQTNPNISPNLGVFMSVFRESQLLNIPIFIKNNLKDFLQNNYANDMFIQQLPWRISP